MADCVCRCGCGATPRTFRGNPNFASVDCRARFERRRAEEERVRKAALGGNDEDEAIAPPPDDRPSLEAVYGRVFGEPYRVEV